MRESSRFLSLTFINQLAKIRSRMAKLIAKIAHHFAKQLAFSIRPLQYGLYVEGSKLVRHIGIVVYGPHYRQVRLGRLLPAVRDPLLESPGERRGGGGVGK